MVSFFFSFIYKTHKNKNVLRAAFSSGIAWLSLFLQSSVDINVIVILALYMRSYAYASCAQHTNTNTFILNIQINIKTHLQNWRPRQF